MALVDQRHTVRFTLPDFIPRGVAHTLFAPIYLDGALVVPVGPTVSIYNASNVAVVDAAAATVVGSIAEYAIASGDLTGEDLGEHWRIEWVLPVSGLVTPLAPRNDAALVLSGLLPVISDVDVIRRHKALDPAGAAAITRLTTFQDELDEAWTEITLRLIALGNRPNLIMEPSALRQVHLMLTIAIIYEGSLSSRLDDAYEEAARRWRDRYEMAWSQLSPRYDVGDDGQSDARRRPASPSIWLSSRSG